MLTKLTVVIILNPVSQVIMVYMLNLCSAIGQKQVSQYNAVMVLCIWYHKNTKEGEMLIIII